MKQIKYKDIPIIRNQMIQEQNGLCALCEHPLDNPCLDHNHNNGLIRGVLCRGCNSALGKIENSMKINKITEEKLINILSNIRDYRTNTTDIIHPIHNRKKRKKKSTRKSI